MALTNHELKINSETGESYRLYAVFDEIIPADKIAESLYSFLQENTNQNYLLRDDTLGMGAQCSIYQEYLDENEEIKQKIAYTILEDFTYNIDNYFGKKIKIIRTSNCQDHPKTLENYINILEEEFSKK